MSCDLLVAFATVCDSQAFGYQSGYISDINLTVDTGVHGSNSNVLLWLQVPVPAQHHTSCGSCMLTMTCQKDIAYYAVIAAAMQLHTHGMQTCLRRIVGLLELSKRLSGTADLISTVDN